MVRYVIRSQRSTVWAYAIWALAVFVLAVSAWHGGWKELVWAAPFALIVAVFSYMIYWNPRIEADQNAIHVVNIVREYFIPWEDLESVETKFGLYLYAFHLPRKVPLWAVPSSMMNLRTSEEKTENSREKTAARKKRTRKALSWDKPAGTYRLTMSLAQLAQTLRSTHACVLGKAHTSEFDHNELNPHSIQAREGARKHAQACGKLSSSGLNVAGIISLCFIAFAFILMIALNHLS